MSLKKHRTTVVGRLYKRTRDPINRPKKIQYDLSEADRILAESLESNFVSHASPTGRCLDCDRRVSEGRKLCGRCLNKHEEERR